MSNGIPKYLFVVLMAAITGLHLSCNSAGNGYGAEFGSSVEVVTPDAFVGGGSGYVTVSVASPDGKPANGIRVRVGCVACELFGATGGGSRIVDPTDVEDLGTTADVVTNDAGYFQFIAVWPAPSFFGQDKYSGSVHGDIGVASAVTDVSVTTK